MCVYLIAGGLKFPLLPNWRSPNATPSSQGIDIILRWTSRRTVPPGLIAFHSKQQPHFEVKFQLSRFRCLNEWWLTHVGIWCLIHDLNASFSVSQCLPLACTSMLHMLRTCSINTRRGRLAIGKHVHHAGALARRQAHPAEASMCSARNGNNGCRWLQMVAVN